MRLSKYTRLGILVFASLTILIWGLSYLQGNDILKNRTTYHVKYDRIEGLVESNKVTINGYQVGQVQQIAFNPNKPGQLVVSFNVDQNIQIPVNTVAHIVSSDLMGTRMINLEMSGETQYHSNNDTILGMVESNLKEQVSMQVLPLKNKAEQLLATLDSAITVLTVIFNEEARQDLIESFATINQTFDNIERTTADLQEIVADEKDDIKQIVSNIESITASLNKNTAALENTINNLSSFSDTLAGVSISPMIVNIENATHQIQTVVEKLNSTEGTAGLLINDDELYNSLNSLSANLAFLVNDIQANPKRYLQFSAIDLGKDYYINASGTVNNKNIVFKIHLVSSENRIPLNSDYFQGLDGIEEFTAASAYSYLIGNTGSYNEISQLHNELKLKFPEASIVAFKNGRLIKLEKALRSLR